MSNLHHILKFIRETDDLDEKIVQQSLKNLVLLDEPENIKKYLLDILKNLDDLSNQLHNCSTKMILNQQNPNTERFYTQLEISKILRIDKDTITKQRKRGNLEFNQKVQGGKVLISTKAMDNFVAKYPKYKNLWENRFFNN